MTLPFENDTNAVVKKLAKQNIKANHRTALSIMSAILIAATFYVPYVLLLRAIGIRECNRKFLTQGIGMHRY